jgi:hypothetical protein
MEKKLKWGTEMAARYGEHEDTLFIELLDATCTDKNRAVAAQAVSPKVSAPPATPSAAVYADQIIVVNFRKQIQNC